MPPAFIRQRSEKLARPRRFERPTFAFGGQRSIQLSYGRLAPEIAETAASFNWARGRKKQCHTGFFDGFLWLSPVAWAFPIAWGSESLSACCTRILRSRSF